MSAPEPAPIPPNLAEVFLKLIHCERAQAAAAEQLEEAEKATTICRAAVAAELEGEDAPQFVLLDGFGLFRIDTDGTAIELPYTQG